MKGLKKSCYEQKMSYFDAPIAPQKDANGQVTKYATLVPRQTVNVVDLHRFITQNEWLRQLTLQVRSAADMRAAKAALLPYVTPYGVFSRRNGRSLLAPSGLIPLDFDHLQDEAEAAEVRHMLFRDSWLSPTLCFISPGGRGVKAFVPAPNNPNLKPEQDMAHSAQMLNEYLRVTYPEYCAAGRQVLDTSGKDPARACFLCYDEGAMLRQDDRLL